MVDNQFYSNKIMENSRMLVNLIIFLSIKSDIKIQEELFQNPTSILKPVFLL